MATQIMSMFTLVFSNLISWLEMILEESGFIGIYLGAFFIALLGRYILQPLFGSAGSDKAKKRDDE